MDPIWSDDWQIPQRLPELVRMHIQPDRAGSYIPDLIVKLATPSARGQPQLTLYKGPPDQESGAEQSDMAGVAAPGKPDEIPPIDPDGLQPGVNSDADRN